MQYCREKLLYTPSTTPLHQPYPVTRGLKSSTAIQPSTVNSSTALYSIQPLHHPSDLCCICCITAESCIFVLYLLYLLYHRTAVLVRSVCAVSVLYLSTVSAVSPCATPLLLYLVYLYTPAVSLLLYPDTRCICCITGALFESSTASALSLSRALQRCGLTLRLP
jgi:hypothetical protein